MPQIDSTDYHDFVFSNGALLGEFDQMYQKSAEIPWHQDDCERLEHRMSREILADFGPFDEIFDLGCGLGYFLDSMKGFLKKNGKLCGIDISPAAVKKARELFPDSHFQAADLSDPYLMNSNFFVSLNRRRENRLVMARGLFWYVFPEMQRVVDNISRIVTPGSRFLICQNFPDLDADFVGKEIIPTPDSLLRYFEKDFRPIVVNYLQDLSRKANDNWLISLLTRETR